MLKFLRVMFSQARLLSSHSGESRHVTLEVVAVGNQMKCTVTLNNISHVSVFEVCWKHFG